LEFYPPTNAILYIVTMPLGFYCFLRAVWPRRTVAQPPGTTRNEST
jgi:hypothetical protein